MVASKPWHELCRFDDVVLARAVATSIAAMEFDVRICASGHPAGTDDADHPGRPPYVVEVAPGELTDLAEVLDEIIDEQQEFDRILAERRVSGGRACLVAVVGLTGAVDLLVVLALLDW